MACNALELISPLHSYFHCYPVSVYLDHFYLFGIFIYVLAIGYISEATASDRNTVPCEVRLEFTRDEAGGQLVRYIFFLQVK